MIDDEIFERIVELRDYRATLIRGRKSLCGQFGKTGLMIEPDEEQVLNINTCDLKEFFDKFIIDLDKELISLGFQPSPLDLKEVGNK